MTGHRGLKLARSASEGPDSCPCHQLRPRWRFGFVNFSPTDPASVVHWPSHYAKFSTNFG